MDQYDSIAEAYRDSTHLEYRAVIEQYTVFSLLGDITGKDVLDMACGEGHYTRLAKIAGASKAAGVDLSPAMIRLAEEEERHDWMGCTYGCQDAADYEAHEQFDVIIAAFLLNYARTAEELQNFCTACHRALRPGGQFVGLVSNMLNPPIGVRSWPKYGLEISSSPPLNEGDVLTVKMRNDDGTEFSFNNYYLSPDTYQTAFDISGFTDFEWHDPMVHPDERNNPHWDDYIRVPPVYAYTSRKPE